MALSSQSDAELWNLILADDYRAFTALFQRHWIPLYRTALKYLKDEESSQEVVHDLFLNVWNRRAHLNIDNFDTYFKAATRYQVYAYVKAHKKSPVIYVEEYELNGENYSLNYGYEKIRLNEFEVELNQQISVLPNRCQEIFDLSRNQQLSNLEIAERLGISKRTVENQITNALKLIRGHIKDIAVIIVLLMLG